MTKAVRGDASPTQKMTLAAMFCAIGLVLPQIFHFLGGNAAGGIFLPMHLPVLLCGMICGWQWGAGVGLILPLISSLTTAMPVMYPVGISMMAELCAYGAVSGLMFRVVFRGRTKPLQVYASLITAMLAGRCVSGMVKALLMMGSANPLTAKAFIASAFLTAWPGIVIQLAVIPLTIALLARRGSTGSGDSPRTGSH